MKSWKFANSRDYVFLKDIEEQTDGKIQELKNTYLCIFGRVKKKIWVLGQSGKFVSDKDYERCM